MTKVAGFGAAAFMRLRYSVKKKAEMLTGLEHNSVN